MLECGLMTFSMWKVKGPVFVYFLSDQNMVFVKPGTV